MTADVSPENGYAASMQRLVATASLSTLCVASLVGLWMAWLLLFPRTGDAIAPLGYGRWAPLHLDLQLYGWCSLPLVGLLLVRYMPSERQALLHSRNALLVWTGALLAGAVSWLSGGASGKLFLSWSGGASVAFALSQAFLWATLAAGWWRRGRIGEDAPLRRKVDLGLLVVLFFVPMVLYLSSQPAVYPPVNPDSGGATGHSLLASSLGIVGLGIVSPFVLSRGHVGRVKRGAWLLGAGWLANWCVYSLLEHGNASHHDLSQVLGLSTLLVWPFALVWWFRRFEWHVQQRPWLIAAGMWSALLVVDGLVLFLPGVLEATKFTNALVAHSHLAMAGVLTALNMSILISLAPSSALAAALANRRRWVTWNAATSAMVVVLTVLGFAESGWTSWSERDHVLVQVVYGVRGIAGAAMVAVGFGWLRASLSKPASCHPTVAALARVSEPNSEAVYGRTC
ncbi:hypothetical protein ASA1KI_35050 [Opitutales bacterium ASA1]|uniref:hypothetical protein n=1 Tax=Congregicoccus parvus TaxID=3081749 RepID=UPI002B2B6452|nr:hypothetical protein ASA1KI_35050 [Opitutales bacterium ASA1]